MERWLGEAIIGVIERYRERYTNGRDKARALFAASPMDQFAMQQHYYQNGLSLLAEMEAEIRKSARLIPREKGKPGRPRKVECSEQ